MPPVSMVFRGEEGEETAFIDQRRAVAAGKKLSVTTVGFFRKRLELRRTPD